MYGHTPPAVIAIDPEWLTDCAAFQRIAAGLEAQLRHRPVWAVVAAPEALLDAAPAERAAVLEVFYRDPADAPDTVDDAHTAVAEALAHHMAEVGAPLPVVDTVPERPPITSAIVAGTWRDAARLAERLDAGHVTAWTLRPEWMPQRCGQVPFRYGEPGRSGLWDSPALA